VKSIDRLKAEIYLWKVRIQQNAKECNARNKALRKEKEKISKHYQELKNKMLQFRDDESRRLAELTKNSKACMDTLKSFQRLADKILKTSELCRKLETEKVK
jgi:dynein regulatory complex subunit 2